VNDYVTSYTQKPCGCRAGDTPDGMAITFCDLHEAASDLLAACKALPLDREFTDAADYKDASRSFDAAMSLAREAIAKVKTK